MRGLRWAMRTLAGIIGMSVLLAGCAAGGDHGAPVVSESQSGATSGVAGSSASASAITLAASVIYPVGPWERDAGDTLNRKPMQTRAFASEPDAAGVWTVIVRQRESEQAAWSDVQSLRLSRDEDGAVVLHELTTFARGTKAIFTPALALCPAIITSAPHEATAQVRSTGLDGSSDARTGTARATAVATGAGEDASEARLTLVIHLGPAKVTRTANFLVRAGADAPASERSELVVKGGPFVLQREVRERK